MKIKMSLVCLKVFVTCFVSFDWCLFAIVKYIMLSVMSHNPLVCFCRQFTHAVLSLSSKQDTVHAEPNYIYNVHANACC